MAESSRVAVWLVNNVATEKSKTRLKLRCMCACVYIYDVPVSLSRVRFAAKKSGDIYIYIYIYRLERGVVELDWLNDARAFSITKENLTCTSLVVRKVPLSRVYKFNLILWADGYRASHFCFVRYFINTRRFYGTSEKKHFFGKKSKTVYFSTFQRE